MIDVKDAVPIAFRLFPELYDTKKFADVVLVIFQFNCSADLNNIIPVFHDNCGTII